MWNGVDAFAKSRRIRTAQKLLRNEAVLRFGEKNVGHEVAENGAAILFRDRINL